MLVLGCLGNPPGVEICLRILSSPGLVEPSALTLAMAKSKAGVSIICSGVGATIFDVLCKTGSTVSQDWPGRTDTHAFRNN